MLPCVRSVSSCTAFLFLRHFESPGCCAMFGYPSEACDGYFESISMQYECLNVCGPIRTKSNDVTSGLSTLINSNIFLHPPQSTPLKCSKSFGNESKP